MVSLPITGPGFEEDKLDLSFVGLKSGLVFMWSLRRWLLRSHCAGRTGALPVPPGVQHRLQELKRNYLPAAVSLKTENLTSNQNQRNPMHQRTSPASVLAAALLLLGVTVRVTAAENATYTGLKPDE